MTPRAAVPTIVLNLAGLVLLVLGWVSVSGKASLSDQGPYVNIALAGLLLAGVGNALYIMATRRTLEARLAVVHERIAQGPGDVPRPNRGVAGL